VKKGLTLNSLFWTCESFSTSSKYDDDDVKMMMRAKHKMMRAKHKWILTTVVLIDNIYYQRRITTRTLKRLPVLATSLKSDGCCVLVLTWRDINFTEESEKEEKKQGDRETLCDTFNDDRRYRCKFSFRLL
jgi:hypothetical protein